MQRGAALLVLLVACGTGSVATPANENSGAEPRTRLRAKVWSVDGVELFRRFRDSKRKEDCFFVQGDDAHAGPGPTHWCLPVDSTRHDATGGLALFADKACTVPLALAPLAGRASYVITRGPDSCAEPPRVFHAQDPQEGRPYFQDGAACARAATTVTLQALGDEIPLSEFESAVETDVPLPGQVGRLDLVTSDGARQTIGGFDRSRAVAVEAVDPGGAGDRRWLPARFAYENGTVLLYRDASCTTPVPAKIARDAICPLGAGFVFEGECGNGKVYELGPSLAPSTLFEKTASAACAPSQTKGVLAYERGAELSRTTFAPATTAESGAGRVHLRGDADGANQVTWTGFFDTQTAEACVPATAKDGQVRCLPATNVAATLFADAECKGLAFEEVLLGCGAAPERKFVRSEGRAFRVTGPAPVRYERGANGCVVRPSAEGTQGFAIEEVDVAPFSLVTEVTH